MSLAVEVRPGAWLHLLAQRAAFDPALVEFGAFNPDDFDLGHDRQMLDGEHDLFGDGTVKLIPTPGHTIGHQSMKVKLPKMGTVILTQDAVWMQENLDGYVAGLNFSVQAYSDSVNRIKMMRDLEGAQILMSHDANQFAKMGDRWHK